MFYFTEDDVSIYFGEGRFDKYCVYVNDKNRFRYAMTDDEYFEWILNLSKRYGVSQVWDDFCSVYDIISMDANVKPDVNEAMLTVADIDMHYNEETVKWWLVFYMTMVAECKKRNAILKKRIKKLGVYNLFFDGYDIPYVITYMRGMHWKELDKLMKERGI